MDQLRSCFRAGNCPEGHDQPKSKIDIAEGAMLSHRHDRFANDVREVRADSEIPVQSHDAQRRAGNETPADSEKAAQNPDHKPHDDEINRADVRAGDGKRHHFNFRLPRISRSKIVVTFWRRTA